MDAPQDVLRFITCGSVDDGKSTLIGRLLYETRHVLDDQLAALEADSRRYGTQGGALDFALLVDGLAAEREQGITIDVAYRYFATARRRFIVADTPGHEQYTRNMATGASNAQLAILLVDARKGLLAQTFRHARIVSLMGIRQVVPAVNKMDAVAYDEAVFRGVEEAFRPLARELELRVRAVPLSALTGDNVLTLSPRMPWYAGEALLPLLEHADTGREDLAEAPVALPVQYVCRPGPDFRGVAGRVAQGTLRRGASLKVLPSGVPATVKRIVALPSDRDSAVAGESVMVELDEQVDVSRGNLLVGEGSPVAVTDEVEADLLWMAEEPLVPGRSWWVRLHAAELTGTVTALRHRVDVQTGNTVPASALEMNGIGRVTLRFDRPVPVRRYGADRVLGAAVLVDKLTHATAGAAMVRELAGPGKNLFWQATTVDQQARSRLKGQTPQCVWFTGLSGSGKSTIANLVEAALHARGRHTYLLDGDNVRHGLNRDLGFSAEDRAENIRRVAEVARLMVDAGLIVLVSFISPFRAERGLARSLFRPGQFVEVFVDTPLEVCEARDPKGLYARARRGELKRFTGLDSPYEAPEKPDIRVTTLDSTPSAAVEKILGVLTRDVV